MTEDSLHDVKTDWEMEYAVHDGVRLTGNLYRPVGVPNAPIVIAIHGGAWKAGDAKNFQYWGPWLAARGIAVYSIEYRLASGEKNRYPAAILDVRSAVQFVRANASGLGVDGMRIALMGASAGAHLAAFVALAGELPPFASGHPDDPHPGISTEVKLVVAAYGVYDMLASWEHDQLTRAPNDQPTEIFLGVRATENKFRYFEASPIAYATTRANKTSFLLTWGTEDDVVDWTKQTKPFLIALKQAGFFVRTVPVQAAPHFWMYGPIDEPHSHVAFVAPKVLRFLREKL
jgi:acetyl esterase/lipase